MKIFDEINEMSAEEFLRYVELADAKDGKSYRCPVCNKGANGDGIRPRLNSKGQVKWHCFGACGKDYSNFDLAAATLGLDSERDTAEAARRLKDLFGLSDDENFSFSKNQSGGVERRQQSGEKNSKRVSAMNEHGQEKTASTSEPKDFSKLFEFCRKNYDLDAQLESLGGAWRGLSSKTLKEAGVLCHGDYIVEAADKEKGTPEVKSPVMIIPCNGYYFWREIDGKRRGVSKGAKRKLFFAKPLSLQFPNFLTEAALDALSMKQALGNLDVGVVATGSAGFVQMTITELEKQFADVERKPSFLVTFDNDTVGKANGLKLVTALRAAGYPAELFFLEEQMAREYETFDSEGNPTKRVIPKIDANDLLQRGDDMLISRLLDGIDSKDKFLKEQASAMRTSKEQEQRAAENRSGIRERGFAEYFMKKFADDVSLTARYSERLTGFDNLDGQGKFKRGNDGGQKLIFLPGLYTLGATPGAGKTSFAWQLLNQLAERGESCFFVSYEMSEAELFSKSLAREMFKKYPALSRKLRLSSANIRRGACNDCAELQEIILQFQQSKLNLSVLEVTNANVVTLLKHLEPKVADVINSGGNPPTIAIDYLQIIPPVSNKATAKEKIDDIMLRLKNFQRDTNSTIIIISAFNRANEFKSEPSLSSFRESSSIEYSSDVSWALETKEESKMMNPRPVKFKCLKNRNGAIFDAFFNYYAGNEFFQACVESDWGVEEE